MNRVELLAPAGSPESFQAAINAGADAVYLAGDKFGARAYATNFKTEEIIEALKTAHILNRKIYLTLNTLVKESEFSAIFDYVEPLYLVGLDGVIVQDLGVVRYLNSHFPAMEVHASTQMSICTPEGAALMKEMQVSRIVPARELSLEEIKQIKKETNIEIESFIHGAMCYCYSGQCLFSSMLGGRSGNRGRCAQPCRLPYKLMQNEGYYLSLKDMCTLKDIPALIEAGIDSFKIEGRMKRPEYVAGVTSIYRKYIDIYYTLCSKHGAARAKELYKIDHADQKMLESLYIRSEIQNGYYYKHNGRDMITLKTPAYKETPESILTDLKGKYLSFVSKTPINIIASFIEGSPAYLSISDTDSEIIVSIEGDIVESALNQPITEDNIKQQLSKLGDTPFIADELVVTVSDKAFYSLKKVNELRRKAVDLYIQELLYGNDFERISIPRDIRIMESSNRNANKTSGGFSLSFYSAEQLSAAVNWMERHSYVPETIYIRSDLLIYEQQTILPLLERINNSVKILLNLPMIYRFKDRAYLEKCRNLCEQSDMISGLLLHSIDELAFFNNNDSVILHTDAGLYAWNSEAVKLFAEKTDHLCIPYELHNREQRELPIGEYSFSKVIYGRIPMMVTANCVRKSTGKCNGNQPTFTTIVDRYNVSFPVYSDCRHCQNIIYNSLPISLHRDIAKWENRVNLRVDFTTESKADVNMVLDYIILSKGQGKCPYEYTTGHEKKGVE